MKIAPPPEVEVLRRSLEELRKRLPPEWKATFDVDPPRGPRGAAERPDAVLRIEGPQRRCATVIVEAKGEGSPRVTRGALEQLRRWRGKAEMLLVAPYLSERSRTMATESGVNYADLTGNIRLSLSRPALFLQDRGADNNPFRGKGPDRGLAGGLAGRVILWLCQLAPPVPTAAFEDLAISEVAGKSGVSLSYVSRIIALLEREDLVRRRPRGPIEAVDRPGLVRRWAEDYALLDSNRGRLYLDPRGPENALRNMAGQEFQRLTFAITGSFAARRYAPIAPPTKLVCFVEDPGMAAGILGLSPASGAGNVFLLSPYDSVVFEERRAGKMNEGGAVLAFCPPAQVAVDCLTGPDRMPAEGEALLGWLEANEPGWSGLEGVLRE